MMLKKCFLWILACACGLFAISACEDSNEESGVIDFDESTANVSFASQLVTLKMRTDRPYTVTTDDEWIKIVSDGRSVAAEHEILVRVDENPGYDRIGEVVLYFEDNKTPESVSFTIKQTASPDVIVMHAETARISPYEQEITFNLTTNRDYTVVSNAEEWLAVVSAGRAAETYTVTLLASDNSASAESRTGEVVVSFRGAKADTAMIFTVMQEGRDYMALEGEVLNVTYEEQEVEFKLTTNREYTAASNTDWISVVDNGRSVEEYTLTLKVEENTSIKRTGTVSVKYKGLKADSTVTINVVQEPGANIAWAKTWSEWPEYDNAPYYNFADHASDYPEPTKNMTTGVFRNNTRYIIEDRYWVFYAGDKKRSLIDSACVIPMLNEYNRQFGYLRENMGWPPDNAVRNGYRSMILLYGSNLRSDNVDSTELGGWQSAINGYPCVLMSYYPVYCFSPACKYSDKAYQTGAAIHEGIHAVFASMPGCRDCPWFHEGANTWLQAALNIEMGLAENPNMNLDREEFGWLCMSSILAPFIPIECYGGWLANDNSFAGPGAQGNNGDNCRYKLGGSQYSSVFPSFLEVAMTKYAMPWIWSNMINGYVLEGISKEIGEEAIQRLILEYRARLCLADMGVWSGAVKNMYNSCWNEAINPENSKYSQKTWRALPYVSTTVDDDGWYVPNEYTLPGWSGANIIPFIVNSDTIAFEFKALNTTKPMKFMVCYNTADGTPVYSEAFNSGETLLMDLSGKTPANNAIFLIACNVEYKYTGDALRKAKYDFRVRPLTGIAKKGTVTKKYWDYKQTL